MAFLKNFYSVGDEDGNRVSERVIQANWTVAIGASPIGTVACVDAWLEDFRKDIAARRHRLEAVPKRSHLRSASRSWSGNPQNPAQM